MTNYDDRPVWVRDGRPQPVWIAGGSGGSGGAITAELSDTGVYSAGNSTTALLLAGATFTGVGESVLDYSSITVSVVSDQVSANLGLEFQFSRDGITWVTTDDYTYENGGNCQTYTIQRVGIYFRVVYTNGAVNQTQFDLCTIYNVLAGVQSSHRIGALDVTDQNDAALTLSVLKAQQPDGIYRNIGATFNGGLLVANVETNPAGAMPVSQLTTLHDGKVLNRLMPEILEIVGTGTASLDNNKINMVADPGEYSIIQTRRRMPYYSGKVQKVEWTFDNFAPQDGWIKQVGYFSSSTVAPYNTTFDGMYLESSGGSVKFVAERAGTKTIELDITQWAGYSSLGNYQNMATWDNFTVVEVNFLWLGGAFIELRLVTQYGFRPVIGYVYAGTSQDVFIKSPNQPVRYQIRDDGTAAAPASFRYICNQVATGGSTREAGLSKGVNTGHATFNLTTIGTTYPVLAVRKGATFPDNPVKIRTIEMDVATANDQLLWTLQINPAVSAPMTFAAVANSAIERAIGDGVITVTSPGIVIANGNLETGLRIPADIFDDNFLAWLSGSIDGTQDRYVLCATPTTGGIGVKGAMNLVEG